MFFGLTLGSELLVPRVCSCWYYPLRTRQFRYSLLVSFRQFSLVYKMVMYPAQSDIVI